MDPKLQAMMARRAAAMDEYDSDDNYVDFDDVARRPEATTVPRPADWPCSKPRSKTSTTSSSTPAPAAVPDRAHGPSELESRHETPEAQPPAPPGRGDEPLRPVTAQDRLQQEPPAQAEGGALGAAAGCDSALPTATAAALADGEMHAGAVRLRMLIHGLHDA